MMPDILEIATLMEDADLRGPATIELRPMIAGGPEVNNNIDFWTDKIYRLREKMKNPPAHARPQRLQDIPGMMDKYLSSYRAKAQKEIDHWQARIDHLTGPRIMNVDVYGITKSFYRTIVVAGVRKMSPVPVITHRKHTVVVPGIIEVKRNESVRQIWGIFANIRAMYEPWLAAKAAEPDPDPDLDLDIFNVDRFGEAGYIYGDRDRPFENQEFIRFIAANYPEWAKYASDKCAYERLKQYTVTKYYEMIFYVSESNILRIDDA